MSRPAQIKIDAIEVIPNAGAKLSVADDWRDSAAWSDDDPRAPEEASTVTAEEMQRFLAEEHHRLFGRPWSLGAANADYLRGRGIAKKTRVLDFGCGAGRVGHHLLADLDPSSYVGIDRHLPALKAFAAYEIPLRRLEDKKPTLIWGGVETLRFLQPGYDIILDLFAATHLPADELEALVAQFARLLAPGGRWISLASDSTVAEAALEAGFKIAHKHVQDIPLFWSLPAKKSRNSWVEYSLAGRPAGS